MTVFLRSLAVIAALTFAPLASAQQVEEIFGLSATRLQDPRDQALGCSLQFKIMHSGEADVPPAAVSGSIATYMADDRLPGFLIKIAYIAPPGVFVPPTEAFLVNEDGSTTKSALLRRSVSDTGKHALFNFRDSEEGLRAIGRLANVGIARLRVRTPDGAESVWGIDLISKSDVQRSWADCLAEQGFPIRD